MAEIQKPPVVEEVGPYRAGIVVTSDEFVAQSGISTYDVKTGKTQPKEESKDE